MREIKFKAKRVDSGEWVEGYLTSGFKENQFYIDTCRKFSYEENSLEIYEVHPETVCQYTGLKDKNGKEIWEGDIVKYKTSEQGKENEYYNQEKRCIFYRGVFSIGSGNLYEWTHENGGLDMPLKWRHYISYGAKATYMLDFDLEVIGNIHNNNQ